MKLITCKNLTLGYETGIVINDLSFEIEEGSFLSIVGENGAGKSTLMKALLGLKAPMSGKVIYHGFTSEAIGYLPQQVTFDREFPISVLEVVLSGLQSEKSFARRYTKADTTKAMELLESMNIASIADKLIGEISGGQMQRALLCRAIISEPKLLILDEPANFVDSRFESELYNILKELNKRMAIVMVSHNINAISSAVKSIVCVNRTTHRHNSNTLSERDFNRYCFLK